MSLRLMDEAPNFTEASTEETIHLQEWLSLIHI